MGSGYSADQQKEFETYRQMLDRAIKDKEPFQEFNLVKNALERKLQSRQP